MNKKFTLREWKLSDKESIAENANNRNTLEFLGTWEMLHNSAFKDIEFDTFLYEAGANRFNMTPKGFRKLGTKNTST